MKSRQIILDTETTGLFPESGDRIVEICCLEIIDGKKSNHRYQTYINPHRESNPEALKVHGLSAEFLADKPKFCEIVEDFLKFIEDATLIIHNAPFDINFLNHELALLGKQALQNHVVDTRTLAQQLFTKEFLTNEFVKHSLIADDKIFQQTRLHIDDNQKLVAALIEDSKFRVHSLDNLCRYYRLSLSNRAQYHSAFVDCELLADVFFHLQNEQAKRAAAVSSISNVSMFKVHQEAIVSDLEIPVLKRAPSR